MQKLVPAFEKQTGIHVQVSLGSSGNFFAQIENGAPFDVFLSADMALPERMVHDGFVFPGNRFAFEAMSPGWGKVMDAIARVTADAVIAPEGRPYAI